MKTYEEKTITTKEEFKDLSISEQVRILTENPGIIDELGLKEKDVDLNALSLLMTHHPHIHNKLCENLEVKVIEKRNGNRLILITQKAKIQE